MGMMLDLNKEGTDVNDKQKLRPARRIGQGPGPSHDLTNEQLAALEVLARGGTAEEAGAAAGVTGRTVRRWDTKPEFQAALARQLSTVNTKLAEVGPRAIERLSELMDSSDQNTARRAADTLAPLGAAVKESAQPRGAAVIIMDEEVMAGSLELIVESHSKLRLMHDPGCPCTCKGWVDGLGRPPLEPREALRQVRAEKSTLDQPTG